MDTPAPSAHQPAVEWMDAVFELTTPLTAGQEGALSATLSALEGVGTVSLDSAGKVTVEYDPVWVGVDRLAHAIESAGLQIASRQLGSASPVADALHESSEEEK